MIGMTDLGLNLNSLNESMTSSLSTTIQDLNSNSNLNSASSLSWADDEVENYATMKVQHYLDNLEDYLLTGRGPSEKCFDQTEAGQWREFVVQFKLHELLKDSRRHVNEDKLNPVKKGLEIHGHSSLVHSPSAKFGMTSMGYSQFQTPRVRSAYPSKSSTLPTRIRSAYPLKSPALPNTGLRTGTRSGYANDRLYRSPLKNDYMKMLDDTARLSIQSKTMSPTKGYTKRIKLHPPALPRFAENDSVILPPLVETRIPLRSKSKPRTTPAPFVTGLKSASGRKPASALQRMPPLSRSVQQNYRQMYNNLSPGNIELVGTSLSLFEPVARPVRPIAIPKLRTNT